MEPLVEVVTNQELELALSVKAQVIGVNNRSSVQKGHGWQKPSGWSGSQAGWHFYLPEI